MGLKKMLLLMAVGAISAGVGIAVPLMLSAGTAAPAPASDAHDDHANAGHGEDAGHGKADDHGKAAPPKKDDGHGKKDDHAKKDDHGKKDAGHGKEAHGKDGHGPALSGPQFVPFGRIVVNLNEPTLTKYLSMELTLQTEPRDLDDLKSAIETRLPIVRTWLTAHLADKTIDDIRGKVGINRLRREIQDQFNALLFTDGRERVTDVLFEEFHVE